MQSASSKAIDEIIGSYAAPVLKSAGFRRKGRNFRRTDGEFWHCVWFQASRFNTPESAEFTINLDIGVTSFDEAMAQDADRVDPVVIFSERIGQALGTIDTWWTVAPETDLAAIGDEVAEALRMGGMPHFARNADRKKLLDSCYGKLHDLLEEHFRKTTPVTHP